MSCELNEKLKLHLQEVSNMQLHEHAAICCSSEKRKKKVKMEFIHLLILSEFATLNTVLLLWCAYERSGALHIHEKPVVDLLCL